MTEILSMKTVFVFSSLIALMLFACMLYVYRKGRTYEGFRHWTLASLLYALGSCLIILRNIAPDLVSIIAANILLIASMLIISRGLVEFFAVKQSTGFDAVCLLFVSGFVSLFTYGWPDINVRIMAVTLAVVVINGRCSYLVYRYSTHLFPFRNRMLSSMFAFVAACFLVRGVYSVIFARIAGDLMAAGAVHSLSVMAFTVGTIGIYVGLITINAQRVEEDLLSAQKDIKTLKGFIPICASCKKVRDDEGFWNQIESYISQRSDAKFSHGICPDCAKKLYPDLWEEMFPRK